jgi:hypothetical protein
MSHFNSNTNKKDDGARNAINSRMQNFISPNYHTSQGQTSKHYKDDNLLGNNNKYNSTDRSDFKNDINQRINSFNRMDDIGHKQLPFHNNIRDYTITMDSKKDEFNDRLSNYNHLSSNIKPSVNQQNQFNNLSFHKTFKEDTNKRLEELSPLSRNLGIPFNGTEMPKKPDFGNNIQANFVDDKFTNYTYEEQFKKKEEDDREKDIYLKNYQEVTQNKMNREVNYNSYDNFNFDSFQADDTFQSNQEANLEKLKHQKNIENFDYSLISNQSIKKKQADQINKLPDLAVYQAMPVDTRQEFHFNQQL